MGAFKPIWTPVDSGESIIEAFGGLDLDYINERYRIYDPALGRLVEKPWTDIVNNRSLPAGRTYWDADGVLQTAAADAPVIEYDPVTGVKLGNRIWGSYENKLTQTEDFTSGNWAKNAVDVEVVDGRFRLLRENTVPTEHYIQQTVAHSLTADATFVFIVKPYSAGAQRAGRLRCYNAESAGNSFGVDFNLQTVTSSPFVAGNGVVASQSIEALPNGEFRVTVTGRTVTPGNNVFARCFLMSGGTSVYAGDGVSGFYIATPIFSSTPIRPPYAKTTISAVTIPTEAQIIGGQNFLDLFNPSSVTMHADVSTYGGSNGYFLEANDGDGSDRLLFRFDGAQGIRGFSIKDATVNSASISDANPNTLPTKAALRYEAAGLLRVTKNGSISPGAGDTGALLNQLIIGNGQTVNSSLALNGHIRRVIVLRKALPDSLLQRITQL